MAQKYATQEQFEYVKNDVDECKGLIFDIKDNHLKHLRSDLCETKTDVAYIKGKITTLLWMVPVVIAAFSGIVIGIIRLLG